MKRFGTIFLAVALLLSTGTQWIMLQSVAWMGMIVGHLEKAPLTVALKETFDGQHPCRLCKAIAAAKKSGTKSASAIQVRKLEFPPSPENPALAGPTLFQLLPGATNAVAVSLVCKPPTPPPRGFFV